MLDVEKKQGNFRAVVSAVVSNNLLKMSTPVNPPSGLVIPRAPTPPLIQVFLVTFYKYLGALGVQIKYIFMTKKSQFCVGSVQ